MEENEANTIWTGVLLHGLQKGLNICLLWQQKNDSDGFNTGVWASSTELGHQEHYTFIAVWPPLVIRFWAASFGLGFCS